MPHFFILKLSAKRTQRGWTLTDKDGSGLFFEKQGEKLIVTTQKWTSEYVLVDIPADWKE
ncbi:hypothetical protein [Ureibacillus sp. FSL E2-3493]|uniref:hypothetical protein n=1 Tax=Ureibacillus sp. FSL E2-3493 TaxID=2921367 RepID=UPI00311A6C49